VLVLVPEVLETIVLCESCPCFNSTGIFVALVLCRILVNQQAQFRKQCNAFFVDLVSTMCFKDNSPPCEEIILHLLSFLMVEASTIPFIRGSSIFSSYILVYGHSSMSVVYKYMFGHLWISFFQVIAKC